MTKYFFEKPTITPHVLKQQLEALKQLLDLRDKAHEKAWQDTEPMDADDLDECNAFDEDPDARKLERKR
jgi:hypothetical protein